MIQHIFPSGVADSILRAPFLPHVENDRLICKAEKMGCILSKLFIDFVLTT